jgi:hypothetical protein
MKRVAALMIGALMLAAPVLTAGAAGASRVAPSVVKGNYIVLVHWNGGAPGYQSNPVTLNKDHTGHDNFGDVISWSLSGKSFHMSFTGPNPAEYFGTKTRNGFNKESKPGTVVDGPSNGTWYAIKNA